MVDQFEWYTFPVANPVETRTHVGYLLLEFCNTCADPEGGGAGGGRGSGPPWKITKI